MIKAYQRRTMKAYLKKLFKSNIALAEYTTFRIGGPARLLCCAEDEQTVIEAATHAAREGIPWCVIGAGSNILANDDPIDRAIIAFTNTTMPRLEGNEIIVSGGTYLETLVDFCTMHGIDGFDRLAGIPGTVGGAIAGNAGAYGTQATDALIAVRVLTQRGAIDELSASDLGLGYRNSTLKNQGAVVLQARFHRVSKPSSELQAAVEETRRDRQSKHPDYRRFPTAGSFFKNLPPAEGETRRRPAGKLLEEVGAKELRVGGAGTWPQHANILVNWGGATARDMRTLADQMAQRVRARFGVDLEREVTFLD